MLNLTICLTSCLVFFPRVFQFTLLALVSTVPGSAGVRLEDAQIFDGQKDRPVILDAVSLHRSGSESATRSSTLPNGFASHLCYSPCVRCDCLCVNRATFPARPR